MKKIIGMMAFVAIAAFFSSCEKDPCYVGNWTMSNPPWILGTNVTIEKGGTGNMVISDPSCSGNDMTRRYTFTYTYNDNTMAIAFSTQGKKCGNDVTFTGNEALSGITGTLTCENNTMSLVTSTYTYNFTRN
ncbi:MAG: hypothetical protein N2167_10955 [Flavobacteriales bacterium]|nr:hypothetical protein [Flavobacteriales bacterium]